MTYDAVLGYVGGSRQKYADVQEGIREGFATPWEGLLAEMVLRKPGFCGKAEKK